MKQASAGARSQDKLVKSAAIKCITVNLHCPSATYASSAFCSVIIDYTRVNRIVPYYESCARIGVGQSAKSSNVKRKSVVLKEQELA